MMEAKEILPELDMLVKIGYACKDMILTVKKLDELEDYYLKEKTYMLYEMKKNIAKLKGLVQEDFN